MIEFFKAYFNFSHQTNGYRFLINSTDLIKVSKKERIVHIIFSYIIVLMSWLIFLIPLRWYQSLIIWYVIISIPTLLIFHYDFRILKIYRLYRYSKSKNINKRIIYYGYMIKDDYKLFLRIFNDYGKKRICNDNNSFRYRLKCFWKNNKLIIIVTPKIIKITINNYKEKKKNNTDTIECIFKKIHETIKINSLWN